MSLKPQIFAEVGLSHEGSLGQAKSLIAAAADSGADFVKFQCHLAEAESSRFEKFRVSFSEQDKSRFDYWKRTEFSFSQWELLVDFARSQNISFACSVFSEAAIDLMEQAGVSTLKVGSGDLTNFEIHERLFSFGGKVIVSTGMATYAEIDSVVKKYKENFELDRFSLMQCTSIYPTPFASVGLNNLALFKELYSCSVGLSDHSEGISASLAAITLGADLIEKHITFHKKSFGPDVSSSISLEQLGDLVDYRNVISLLKNPVDKDLIADDLVSTKHLFGRSLALKGNFKIGEIPSLNDFCLKKPGGGLDWETKNELVGLPLKKDYSNKDLLSLDYFDKGVKN